MGNSQPAGRKKVIEIKRIDRDRDRDRERKPPAPAPEESEPEVRTEKKKRKRDSGTTESKSAASENKSEDARSRQTQESESSKRKKTRSPKPGSSKEPERFVSATDVKATQRNENFCMKFLRMTGFREMSVKNLIVMLFVFSLRFFVPWVHSWWEYNKHLLSDPSHMEELGNWLFTQEIIAFAGSCVACLAIAAFADVFNLKYYIYLLVIVIYILCPATGIYAINILWARGYSRTYYHRNLPRVYVMMLWTKSIPFIAYPLEFSAFYTQVDDMSRMAHYNYAALFAFLDAVNRLLCYFLVPDVCPVLEWTLATVWIAIGILLHTVFLLSSFLALRIKKNVKMLNRTRFTIMIIKKVNKVLTSMKLTACRISETGPPVVYDNFNSKATLFMKKMKLILLGLVVLPVIYSSLVIAILHRLEVEEAWDKHEWYNAASMFVIGRVAGVLIIATALFFIRRNKKIFKKFSFTRPDVLALGLPHAILILSLCVIAVRFGTLLNLEEGDVMIGPIPDEDRSVIEFYNADFRNRTVCVSSEKFLPVKIGPRERGTRKPPAPDVTLYEIVVSLTPRSTPPVETPEALQYQPNALITYVVALNSTEETINDLEAFYNIFRFNKIEGTESVKPKLEPQLIIINTFMLNTTGYFFTLTQYQSNYTNRLPVPERTSCHVVDIVEGRLDIKYENEGNNSQTPTPPILTYIEVQNYTVWSLVLGQATARNGTNDTEPFNVIITKHLMMQVAAPENNPLPSKGMLQEDLLIMIGMFLGGVAEGGMHSGYLYLFWLDTPMGKLRATTYACFLIFLSIPQEFPRLRLVDITTPVAVFLLVLQILFTICHFIGATFLYDTAFNFRKRDDAIPS